MSALQTSELSTRPGNRCSELNEPKLNCEQECNEQDARDKKKEDRFLVLTVAGVRDEGVYAVDEPGSNE